MKHPQGLKIDRVIMRGKFSGAKDHGKVLKIIILNLLLYNYY